MDAPQRLGASHLTGVERGEPGERAETATDTPVVAVPRGPCGSARTGSDSSAKLARELLQLLAPRHQVLQIVHRDFGFRVGAEGLAAV
jgi:hypothetical protein